MKEKILECARRIIDIEFNGRQTWDSCMESARERAITQAEVCWNVFDRHKIVTAEDARFLSIVKLLTDENKLLAIYLVRVTLDFGLAEAKNFVDNIEEKLKNTRNPLQIWRKSKENV